MGMREYENLKDLIIPEAQEKIMDIYCAAWEDCHNMGHCKDCPDRQMLKEKFSLLECFSLKYSRMLIEAGYAPVVHARWKPYQTPIETRQSGWICTNCSGVQKDLSNGDTEYCPHCGAKMDIADNADCCVCCGDMIPEGRQVCPACEKGD